MDVPRVVIVDEQLMFAQALAAGLQRAGFETPVVTADAREALPATGDAPPDAFVVSYPLRTGDDTVDLLADIRSQFPAAPAIVLSAYDSPEMVVAYFRAGASDFVSKQAPLEQLVAALTGALDNSAVNRIRLEALRRAAAAADNFLDEECLAILRLIAEGCTNLHIAHELAMSQSSVKRRLAEVFRQLGVQDRASAVNVARDRGLIL
jgi:DNA-binding NarL/FixJ family response regulator